MNRCHAAPVVSGKPFRCCEHFLLYTESVCSAELKAYHRGYCLEQAAMVFGMPPGLSGSSGPKSGYVEILYADLRQGAPYFTTGKTHFRAAAR